MPTKQHYTLTKQYIYQEVYETHEKKCYVEWKGNMAWGWSGGQQNKIKGFAHPSYENAVCLFLQPPLSSRNGLLNKVARWQGWRFCTGSSTWTSTHRGRPGCLHCWVTRLLAAETNVKPRKWLRFWGDQPATWWKVDYIRQLLSWKGQRFVLTGIYTYSGFWYAFPICNVSVKNYQFIDLKNAFTMLVFHATLLLIQELASQDKQCSNGPVLMEFSGVTMFPIILKWLFW